MVDDDLVDMMEEKEYVEGIVPKVIGLYSNGCWVYK